MADRPNKTIIQRPLTRNGQFVKYEVIGSMQLVPNVEVGDFVLTEKRPALSVSMSKVKKAKVANVYISPFDRAVIVELEPKELPKQVDKK